MPSEQPEILFANRQSLPVDVEPLTSLAQTTLRSEGLSRGELSVSFVTADEMAGLHERYAGQPGPTDVLSFPMDHSGEQDRGGEWEGEPPLIGDVVICPEYVARSGMELDAELRLLLVHGILHLLGYDHEQADDRADMWARQERYSGVAGPRTNEGVG